VKIPVNEFEWPGSQDIGPMFTLTCRNHDFLRWSTKHPLHRSVHYLGLQNHGEGATKEQLKYAFQECECKWADLLVIEKED
jgi:hypothetical protein